MRFIVDSKTKTLEFTEAGAIEEVREIIRMFEGYSFRFSAEEQSIFERI